MITLRKLQSLPRKTRLRKILTMLEEWSRDPEGRLLPERSYGRGVMELLSGDERLEDRHREAAQRISRAWVERRGVPDEQFRRDLSHLRFGLMEYLGAAPADWDFYDPEHGTVSRSGALVLPVSVFLDDVRSPFNVGAMFRTAEAFGAERMYLSPYCADPQHKRSRRTSMGCVDLLPWSRIEPGDLNEGPFFALEVGGVPAEEFDFPSEGTVAVGSEELGISPETRERARASCGIVSIPTGGAKGSLNVSVAFGILMHRWFTVLRRRGSEQPEG